jgi:hypothetical protein
MEGPALTSAPEEKQRFAALDPRIDGAEQTVGVSRFRPGGAESRLGSVSRFLVESYVAASSDAFADACERARLTAKNARGVRYVDTTYLPVTSVLHLFDAPSADALEEAGRRAGLQFERIVAAVNEKESRR